MVVDSQRHYHFLILHYQRFLRKLPILYSEKEEVEKDLLHQRQLLWHPHHFLLFFSAASATKADSSSGASPWKESTKTDDDDKKNDSHDDGSDDSDEVNDDDYGTRLIEFYKKQNPATIDTVDATVEK